MQVLLKDNKYNKLQVKDIYFIDGNKTLTIMFGGDGDLYWIIDNINCEIDKAILNNFFEITKENYFIYSLFASLFNDIRNINIFDEKVEFQLYI